MAAREGEEDRVSLKSLEEIVRAPATGEDLSQSLVRRELRARIARHLDSNVRQTPEELNQLAIALAALDPS